MNKVLVDTSIWVDHFNVGDDGLADLIRRRGLVMHGLVLGEIISGNLKNRAQTVSSLFGLDYAQALRVEQVAEFIDMHKLMGQGLNYIDLNILGTCHKEGLALWTRDKKLAAFSETLGLRSNAF